MRIYITHCSARKNDALRKTGEKVTPDKLYTSPRIQRFMHACMDRKVQWAIFSDLYGMWFPDVKQGRQIAKLVKLQKAKEKDSNLSLSVKGLSSLFTQLNTMNVLVRDILMFDDELRKRVKSLEQKLDKQSIDRKSSSARYA